MNLIFLFEYVIAYTPGAFLSRIIPSSKRAQLLFARTTTLRALAVAGETLLKHGAIGVMHNLFEPRLRALPPAEYEYAVEPNGVAIIIPSPLNFIILLS